ncbi:MAG: hypothetical protein ABIH50_02915 [bacterium]
MIKIEKNIIIWVMTNEEEKKVYEKPKLVDLQYNNITYGLCNQGTSDAESCGDGAGPELGSCSEGTGVAGVCAIGSGVQPV